VLEVAAACLQMNAQERLKPVLEAFGILGSHGDQRQLEFGTDPNDDDPNDDDGTDDEGEDNDTHDD
jgi:hypothetical protein